MAANLEDSATMDNIEDLPTSGISLHQLRWEDEQFQPARKLELNARITTGMIQDVGSLLSAVLAQVDLAQGSLEIQDVVGVDRDLEDLRLAALRGTEMIRHMISLNGGQTLEPTTVDLADVVDAAVRRTRSLLPINVELQREHDEAPAVRADGPAVEEIVMRLVRAAARAMPEGGSVLVRTGDSTVTREDCRRRGWGVPGRYGVVSVSDTGPRMSPEALERSFTPLVSGETLEGRRDSLYTTYALMKQHRGFVEVENGPEGGCEVRLLFRPAATTALTPSNALTPGRGFGRNRSIALAGAEAERTHPSKSAGADRIAS